jgi:hypothetical protein
MIMKPYKIELSGKVFGKLTVIGFVCRLNCHSIFKCVCECGKETLVTSNNLRRNHTTSCGCMSSKKTIGVRTATHMMRNHPLYNTWCGMINRCYWDKHNRSKHYKGKGIKICDTWRHSFETFRDWAILSGWKKGLSIDRIDNNGNYEPGNCRWATNKEQARNRTSNVWLTIDGVSKIVIEWSEETGVSPSSINQRLKKGWTHKEAVFGKSIQSV